MKPLDLNRLLRRAQLPGREDEAWQEFPAEVIRRLRHEPVPPVPPARRSGWRVAAFSALAAAAGLALGFGLWHRSASAGPAEDALRDGGVLRQLLAQYPGRLQGIVRNASGLHVLLSDHIPVVASDPIWLEIREGRDRRVVVTFSGQQIQCNGKPVMVLTDGRGQIMLVGEGFFWSDQISAGQAGNVHIRAVRIPDPPRPQQPSVRL